MAIDWTISHAEKLVLATVPAGAKRSDYVTFLAGVADANAVGYRKIVDIRFATLEFKIADVRAYGQIVMTWGKDSKPGPTALIVNSEISSDFAELFRQYARADRPVRVFTDIEPARAWLDEVAPVAP